MGCVLPRLSGCCFWFVNANLTSFHHHVGMQGGQVVMPWLFIPIKTMVLFIPCLLSHGVIPLLLITSPFHWQGGEERIQGSFICG